jgi:hypothetical protein
MLARYPRPEMDVASASLLAPRIGHRFRDGVESLEIRPRRSWKIIGIALAGVIFAMVKEVRGISDFFGKGDWSGDFAIGILSLVWLLWVLAAISEFFGTERLSVARGYLTVSRGVGPVRRTFRYDVREIMELTSVDPDSDEEQKGKGRAHHIFLRAKSGAVRLEYGDKTVFLGETLNEGGGARIVDWLRRRLPRSASELALGLGYRG